MSRLRLPRRAWAINAVLVLALGLVGVMTYRAVAVGSSGPAATARTTTVDTGEVISTVTTSGNVDAARTVSVDFDGSGGVVRAIYVKAGQRVRKGQKLARVDATSARQALRSARSQLDSAEASYEEATQGETPQEQAADQQSVNGAQVAVHGAQLAVRSARETYRLDRGQRTSAVRTAQHQLQRAQQQLAQARAQHRADPNSTTEAAVSEARSQVQTGRTALSAARQARASMLLADRQQIRSQEQGLATARQQLASTKDTVAVSQEPPRDSTVSQAAAQVAGAKVGVDEAQSALNQTTLRAPVAGRVGAVNGTVGQLSSSGSASDSTSSSSTSGSSSSSASGSSSTTSSGFATLVSTGTLQVTADVAEADINDVRVGQPVAVTVSADNKQLNGTVEGVAPTSTVTNNVVEYGVTVRLTGTSGVKVGQTVQLVITTGDKKSVVRVSSSALTTVGHTTTATVQAADGTTATKVVQTGLVGDTFTEIPSGLSVGDVVVIPEQSATTTGGGFTFPGAGRVGGLG